MRQARTYSYDVVLMPSKVGRRARLILAKEHPNKRKIVREVRGLLRGQPNNSRASVFMDLDGQRRPVLIQQFRVVNGRVRAQEL